MIIECSGELELEVPTDAELTVTKLKGDVSIEGVRRVELEEVGGDVELQNIGIGADREKIGEAVALTVLRGDLEVTNASSLRAQREIRGDASLTNVALLEIETVCADLSLQHAEAVLIGTVLRDLDPLDIDVALSCVNAGVHSQPTHTYLSEATIVLR